MTYFTEQKFKLKNGEEVSISSPQESDFDSQINTSNLWIKIK